MTSDESDFHGCADNRDQCMEHRQLWCLNNLLRNKVQSSMKKTDHSRTMRRKCHMMLHGLKYA